MTAPVGGNVGKAFEAMWDAVVDLFFVGVRLVVGFADTLGDDLGIAFPVAGVFAVRALHASSILEEVAAKSTSHDIVKLLRDELVALFLVNLLLSLTDCTLTIETNVEWSSVFQLLGCIED